MGPRLHTHGAASLKLATPLPALETHAATCGPPFRGPYSLRTQEEGCHCCSFPVEGRGKGISLWTARGAVTNQFRPNIEFMRARALATCEGVPLSTSWVIPGRPGVMVGSAPESRWMLNRCGLTSAMFWWVSVKE